MDATRCLREEHQLILKVLDCLELALRDAKESRRVSRDTFEPFVEFFQGFADRCHHCKEEDRLFPCMEQRGIPRDGGPIGVMLHEHELGRMHVRTIAAHLDAADRGDASAAGTVLEHGDTYLTLLRNHIEKEDHCLFGMADQLITGHDLVKLTGAYGEAEDETGYADTVSRCRAVAARLIEKYGVPTVSPGP